MFWSVGWPHLRAEGFFCNLDILYGGLGIGKLQFLIKKIYNFFFILIKKFFFILIKKNLIFFSAVIFFKFLVITLDPDWIRIRIGSGSGLSRWNEYGSATLIKSLPPPGASPGWEGWPPGEPLAESPTSWSVSRLRRLATWRIFSWVKSHPPPEGSPGWEGWPPGESLAE